MFKLVSEDGGVAMYGELDNLEAVRRLWLKRWPERFFDVVEAN